MKKNKPTPGQIFSIPLEDGTFGLGQFLRHVPEAMSSYVCQFFSNRLEDKSGKQEFAKVVLIPISVQFVTPDLLDRGVWKIVSQADPNWAEIMMPDEQFLKKGTFAGAKIIGSGVIREFMNAYHGILPWDMMKDPIYFDHLLLPEAPQPKTRISTKGIVT